MLAVFERGILGREKPWNKDNHRWLEWQEFRRLAVQKSFIAKIFRRKIASFLFHSD
jgi:hypothetical protein